LKYLLDTNILIYAYRHTGGCFERLRDTPSEHIALCSVNLFELEYGLAQSERPQTMRLFINELIVRHTMLDLTVPAATKAGVLRAHLRKLGTPIGEYDLLIAGIALANKLTVVTHNTREFSRVPGLQVEDWYA
jgi:tRNA(fMet)-specific endonuclease VapC